MKPPGIQTKPFKLHRGFQSHNSIGSQKDAQDERKNGSRGQRFKKENNPEYDGEKSQQAVHPIKQTPVQMPAVARVGPGSKSSRRPRNAAQMDITRYERFISFQIIIILL